LTAREIEVLKLLCNGESNQEIGRELWISISTVKAHISSMLDKTEMKNRTELAYQAGKLQLF